MISAKAQKSPEHEGVRQPGKRALLDHLALQHHFPQKLADARPERRQLEIRRGARTANHVQDLAEAPPEEAAEVMSK